MGTHSRATTLGGKYGSQFEDLDAINANFASTATDPDYDTSDINAVIERAVVLLTLCLIMRSTNFCHLQKNCNRI